MLRRCLGALWVLVACGKAYGVKYSLKIAPMIGSIARRIPAVCCLETLRPRLYAEVASAALLGLLEKAYR